jgi:ABC-type glycerol-3-phosphate transport system substrate-binding protein
MPAFDGQLFDDEGRVILDKNGYLEWLTWLWDAQSTPGVFITPAENSDTEGEQLEALATGQVAYYIGSSSELNILQSMMGTERLGIASLPAGPLPARSLLQVEAFFIVNKPDPQLELAMSFATYMTTEDRQERMMLATGIVPANINVSTDELPAVRAIRTQVQNAIPLPKLPQMTTLLAEGNRLYNELLIEDAIPAQVACEFAVSINRANGFLDDSSSRCEEPTTLLEEDNQ